MYIDCTANINDAYTYINIGPVEGCSTVTTSLQYISIYMNLRI